MRNYITAVFAACALAATAQTAESPLPIVMGENSCTVESWSTTYFSYTASEDQLVILEGVDSPSLTCDGMSAIIANNSQNKTAVFPVKANSEYVLSVFSVSGGEIKFTASATPYAYNDGTVETNPIEASETPFFVPFTKAAGWGSPATPVFMSYTATIDGRLEMYYDGQVSNLSYRESGETNFISITNGNYTGSQWMASIEVDAGQTYIIKGAATTAMMASFKVVQPTPGATCADAWVAKRGQNEIPAEAGSYWYSVTTPAAPASGFVVLKSATPLQNTEITVKSSCTSSYGDIAQSDGLALRIEASANQFRVLNINKKSATADVENFTFTYQDYQTYDKFETAEEIEAGQTVTTPEFGGTYYYAITAPDRGQYFLDLTAEANVVEGTRVELYDEDKDFWALANGTDKLHYEVAPGVTYVIKWECPDSMRSLPFSVQFNAVKQGETESNPIEAVLGDNDAFESASVYYTYTAAEDSWLIVEPTSMSLSRVYSLAEDGSKTQMETFKVGDGAAVRFEAADGVRYLFAFADAMADAKFSLTTAPYAEGETSSNPIVVENNVANLPAVSGKTWYRYDVAESGILELTTSLAYSYSNSIYVYVNEVSNSSRQNMVSEGYGSDKYAMLSMTVKQGDKVYVNTVLSAPQTDAVINFNIRQPEAGETPGNPIAIDFSVNPMDYTFNKTVSYGDDPVWYSIHLNGDIFDMTSEGKFSMTMYAADNTETPVAQSSGSMFGPNYIQNVIISTPGLYLLKLTSAASEFSVTFSEREANEGEVPAKAIPIQPDKVPYEMEFPSVSVSEMPVWYVIELNEGEFNLVQNETATAALYKEGEYFEPVARLSYSYANDNYSISNYKVTTAGKYYYCISSAYTVCNATLSGSAIKDDSGVAGVNADCDLKVKSIPGGLMISGDDVNVNIYTADGSNVKQLQIKGEASVMLASGVYIVTTTTESIKVIVR